MEQKPQDLVLIFDDEATATQTLTRFLQSRYQVVSAKDETEFAQHLALRPSLIFCDLILPMGSGLDFLKVARETSPNSARVLISGFLDQATLIKAINEDLAHRVLAKPFTLEQLELVTAEAHSVQKILVERTYWQEVSLTDGMTHLWNRRGFLQHLVREMHRAHRHHRPLSVLMVDVDHFKQINDSKGHSLGDTALKKLSKVLLESVRSIDWVCRYGGDEFVILLPETGADGAFDVAERIRKTVAEKLQLTVSLGLSHFPLHGEDPATLVEAADKALYSAKTLGRNQTAIAAVPSDI